MNPSALMPEAFIVVLFAPASSVVTALRLRRGTWAAAAPMLYAGVLFVLLSAVVAVAKRPIGSGGELRTIALAHVTLAAAAVAFAAIGAACGALFADVLDASAASAVVALFITFALLLTGDVAGQLPSTVVSVGLTASPLVAIASAANIDVLRDDTWYRLSPIAHRAFNYPAWYQAASVYAAVSLACFGAIVWKRERSL